MREGPAQKSGRPGRPRARAGLSRLNMDRFPGSDSGYGKPNHGSSPGKGLTSCPSSWRPSWQPSSSSSPWKWLLATSARTRTLDRSLGHSVEGTGRRTGYDPIDWWAIRSRHADDVGMTARAPRLAPCDRNRTSTSRRQPTTVTPRQWPPERIDSDHMNSRSGDHWVCCE